MSSTPFEMKWLPVTSLALGLLLILSVGCGEEIAVNVNANNTAPSQDEPKQEQELKPRKVAEEEIADRENWPIFRGNPNSTGVSESTLPDKLEILWEHKVENGAFESTAAIFDSVVYIGDLDGTLFAFDLDTGKINWEFDAEFGFFSAIGVYEDAIFAGNMDGRFFCVGLDGKQRWVHECWAEINGGANFYKDYVLYGAQDATLYCLNRSDGKVAWEYQIDDQIRCFPTIVENRVFVAGCDAVLHIIDLDKQESVGGVDILSQTGATPAVMGDVAYFGTEQAGFFAVDWKEVEVLWTFDDPNKITSVRSNPAVMPGHVIFGTGNGFVYSLNPDNGEINWEFEARGPVNSSPVVAGKRVYIGGEDARMYVLDLDTGKRISEIELNGKIVGSPAVSNGKLIVATNRGYVYCLGKKPK